MKQSQPALYRAACPADFIGGAKSVARILHTKAKALEKHPASNCRLLLVGQPGIGKTELALMFAGLLAGHSTSIESLNGRNVDISLVRRWQESSRYTNIFGGWTVKIVNELDTCPPAAQDLLLTYLDELPNGYAFIGTSNLDLKQLSERFQTRFQQFKLTAPDTDEIIDFIKRNWRIADSIVKQIAVGCGGNVRAALLDTQTIIDAKAA
jgi:MoxR-like ATPase